MGFWSGVRSGVRSWVGSGVWSGVKSGVKVLSLSQEPFRGEVLTPIQTHVRGWDVSEFWILAAGFGLYGFGLRV